MSSWPSSKQQPRQKGVGRERGCAGFDTDSGQETAQGKQ